MSGYKLGITELDTAIGGIKKGSNILMVGPPMSGKETLLRHIMYYAALENENAIIIATTHESADHILESFKKYKPDFPLSRVGIVDCFTKNLGTETFENENIKMVNGPADLTGIGVKISQFLEVFMKKYEKNAQLYINSLSTLLMYSNIQVIFKFLHVLTCRIKASGMLGFYVVDEGMHNAQSIATLTQLCDGLMEVKTENDKHFIRAVGLSPKPTPWFEYKIDGEKVKVRKRIDNLQDKRAKILIVDDERDTVDALRMTLESDNYNVVEAYSGYQAIEKARSEIPDLILLDIMLQDMNGYGVCRRLKKDPLTGSVPIIMLTGIGGVSDKIAGLDSGADDYITKPFDSNELKARIRTVLRRSMKSGASFIDPNRLTCTP